MTGETHEPYRQDYYPPIPTRFTIYRRRSILWQLFRFFAINVKILRVMTNSIHGSRSGR
jgi:hypothetical protein